MAGDYTFSAEVIGADELQRALRQAGSEAGQVLADGLNKSAYLIQPAAVEKAPADTGQLRASIHTELATPQNLESKVGTDVQHAWPMEAGAKPHYVDPRLLMAWAQRKLGNKQLAYPVARAIAKRGLKARKYMKGAFEDKKQAFQDQMRSAMQRIIDILKG